MTKFKAWKTSQDIIRDVGRKITMPGQQSLMSDQDILDFASEELWMSQIPDILQYNNEYNVWTDDVVIEPNRTKYPIPERAIGMKLRDLWYKDTGGTVYSMARVAPDDKNTYQKDNYATTRRYYLQNNSIILADNTAETPTGTLQFEYYIRPNRLVPNERAAFIRGFSKRITFTPAIQDGDSITIGSTQFFASMSPSKPNEFQIGLTVDETAANFSFVVSASGEVVNSQQIGAVVTIEYHEVLKNVTKLSESGVSIQPSTTIVFTAPTPANFVDTEQVDILQTKSGHVHRSIDVDIVPGSVSTNSITVSSESLNSDIVVGDYVALSGECIIPQIPTDLHVNLVEQTCARIMAAMGDNEGLAVVNQKLSENKLGQSRMLTNRVDGSMPKVIARQSVLRNARVWTRRGF